MMGFFVSWFQDAVAVAVGVRASIAPRVELVMGKEIRMGIGGLKCSEEEGWQG